MKIDENINRYCELIKLINKSNKYLKKQKEFYLEPDLTIFNSSEVPTFEEAYSDDIKELFEYQKELKKLIKIIMK